MKRFAALVSLSSIELTPDQQKKLEAIGERFGNVILEIRSSVTAKQLEPSELFRDPLVSESKILIKDRECMSLQETLHCTMLDYWLATRSVLRPDHCRLWSLAEEGAAKRLRQ